MPVLDNRFCEIPCFIALDGQPGACPNPLV